MLILALDVGTSSTRTALFDAKAHRLPGTTAQQTYPLITSVVGGAELDPELLLRAAQQCLTETMGAYRRAPELRGRNIAGIAVSCFWHSLIGTDALGNPLTRVITWADARCRTDAADLRKTFSEKAVHARTGCMLRASFWPAKLVWLRRTTPRLFEKVKRWMSPAEWLQLALAGEAHCAIGMATGTGLFNPSGLAWDTALLEHCGITAERLNPLSDEPVPVGGTLAEQFPELANVPWFPGIGDGAASNLGSGATLPGLAAINVGTSAALRVMRTGRKARAPFGLFCYRVDASRFLVGGAVSNAGNLRAWCLRELRLPDESSLEDELVQRPGPTHGLTVLPFWTAERAPAWNEDDQGAIAGLTQHTTAIDLFQAITEASYHRIARIAELVLASEKQAPKFIVSGGIQRSAVALQRLADVLGSPVYPNEEMEASIRGAAIYAMESLGIAVPVFKLGHPVNPRARFAKLYLRDREKQQALEKACSGRTLAS
ncbi:MAG: gluconokinase [Verrucomicrobiota bacterium]|nr:gluconokinase [Verrucomicrobiota bacterium]